MYLQADDLARKISSLWIVFSSRLPIIVTPVLIRYSLLIHFTILYLEGYGMKVYVHEKGVILVGKGWEVLQKLKEYNKEFVYVSDWVKDVSQK